MFLTTCSVDWDSLIYIATLGKFLFNFLNFSSNCKRNAFDVYNNLTTITPSFPLPEFTRIYCELRFIKFSCYFPFQHDVILDNRILMITLKEDISSGTNSFWILSNAKNSKRCRAYLLIASYLFHYDIKHSRFWGTSNDLKNFWMHQNISVGRGTITELPGNEIQLDW